MLTSVGGVHISKANVHKASGICGSLSHTKAVHVASLTFPVLLLGLFLLDDSWATEVGVEISCFQVFSSYVELDDSN